MWDSVSPEDSSKVLSRLSIACIVMPLTLVSLKHFPVSIVRCGISLGPIYAMILAWIIIGEKANLRDLISVGMGFLAVLLVMIP